MWYSLEITFSMWPPEAFSEGRREITGGLPSATCCPKSSKNSMNDQVSKTMVQQGQTFKRDNETRNHKAGWMGDGGLKEDIGEAVPLSTTARLLTSKRGADRSLDRNVLLQVMSIGEGDIYRRYSREGDRIWFGMVYGWKLTAWHVC
jgi:hypothetical protein